jgi:hypothetical protein
VGVRGRILTVWSAGQLVVQHPVHPVSGRQVAHPDQWTDIAPASTRATAPAPVAYQVPPATPVRRPLIEYDQLCGVTTEVAA